MVDEDLDEIYVVVIRDEEACFIRYIYGSHNLKASLREENGSFYHNDGKVIKLFSGYNIDKVEKDARDFVAMKRKEDLEAKVEGVSNLEN